MQRAAQASKVAARRVAAYSLNCLGMADQAPGGPEDAAPPRAVLGLKAKLKVASDATIATKKLERRSTMSFARRRSTANAQLANLPHKALLDDSGVQSGCFTCRQPKAPSFEHLCRDDVQRKKLLSMARTLSPIDTIGRIGLLPRTVIPRILTHTVSWAVIATYVVTAALCRNEITFTFQDTNTDVMDGSSTLIVPLHWSRTTTAACHYVHLLVCSRFLRFSYFSSASPLHLTLTRRPSVRPRSRHRLS